VRTMMLALALAGALSTAQAAHAAVDPLAPTGHWSAYTGGHAQTPPMGWSSWNAFQMDIDEAKVTGIAQRLVDTGLASKGYRYVNIDDGWFMKRRERDGRLIIRTTTFPSARVAGGGDPSFKPLTDRIHRMGLKAGIYTDLGRNTCSQAYSTDPLNLPVGDVAEREVGIYGHIDQDLHLFFHDWGFDYIKVDGCGVRAFGADSERVLSGQFRAFPPLIDGHSVNRTDVGAVRGLYQQIGRTLLREKPGGDYLYSLCAWGSSNVRAWGKDVGNISRTSDDIAPVWERLLVSYDSAAKRALYAHPGSWNDPDMLFIGTGDFDAAHLTEARSHFALWAMLDAPLIIGADLRTTPQPLLDIFGAQDIIALDQDPAGNQAVVAYDSDNLQVLVKTLADGQKAVAVFNRTLAPVTATLMAVQLKYDPTAPVQLTDLWTHQVQSFQGETKLALAPHQTLIFRAQGVRRLKDGLYLSEQPGSVNPAVDGVTAPVPDPTIHRSSAAWTGTKAGGDRPVYAGWGGAQADSAPYGELLHVAGHEFDTGIGVLANSRLEVRNHGFRRFTAQVGVDDSGVDRTRSVRFEVYGDGRLLGASAPMRWGQASIPLSADVAGVKLIELVARASAPDGQAMPVTWGEAALMTN
jgi:alpha-galactosidase